MAGANFGWDGYEGTLVYNCGRRRSPEPEPR